MIAPAKPRRPRKRSPAWHAGFLAMLPAIVRHARVILPRLRPEARAEALQEIAANAAVAYARLAELGKTDVAYPTPLATYAVRQFTAGRRVRARVQVARHVRQQFLVRERLWRPRPFARLELGPFEVSRPSGRIGLVEQERADKANERLLAALDWD